jgi:SNF2 family DNA or RNA helicase
MLHQYDECPECGRGLSLPDLSEKTAANDFPDADVARFDLSIIPTKLQAVVHTIVESQSIKKRYRKSLSAKVRASLTVGSVVFSHWRSSLDILESLLVRAGIPSLRIDGNASSFTRFSIIKKFSQSMGHEFC